MWMITERDVRRHMPSVNQLLTKMVDTISVLLNKLSWIRLWPSERSRKKLGPSIEFHVPTTLNPSDWSSLKWIMVISCRRLEVISSDYLRCSTGNLSAVPPNRTWQSHSDLPLPSEKSMSYGSQWHWFENGQHLIKLSTHNFHEINEVDALGPSFDTVTIDGFGCHFLASVHLMQSFSKKLNAVVHQRRTQLKSKYLDGLSDEHLLKWGGKWFYRQRLFSDVKTFAFIHLPVDPLVDNINSFFATGIDHLKACDVDATLLERLEI